MTEEGKEPLPDLSAIFSKLTPAAESTVDAGTDAQAQSQVGSFDLPPLSFDAPPEASAPAEATAAPAEAMPDFSLPPAPMPEAAPIPEAPPEPSLAVVEPTLAPIAPVTPIAPAPTLVTSSEPTETVAVAEAVPAACPFHLMIEGSLSPEEKEKLLDLITRENFGFREVDLEPQLNSDRILLPRISEYAATLLVQALRSTQAEITVFPSDAEAPHQEDLSKTRIQKKFSLIENSHAAEILPVTPGARLPQFERQSVIDTVLVSAALKTSSVNAEDSPEYDELLENLQKELKYKAFYKGAAGIINFKVDLTPLDLPSRYRLTLSGAAIKSL